MSLELALQEHTMVMREFLAAMREFGATSLKTVQATVTPNGASNTPETSSGSPLPADVAATKETVSAEATIQADTAGDAPVTYAEAANAVTELMKVKGRDAATRVLAMFGAKNLPGVPPEKFADVIAACKAEGV